YSQTQITKNLKMISGAAAVLKYITCLVLLLGLIWCSYFLILGIMEPARAEYANNMSELIVAVLSVISIMFAFVEFIRRKN
ncbi:transporter, partial [Erysipelatoclostridium ramosum]|uniref:transporter n=1 Tax=Thomasclavelia ramosa TaxID=1547 RepID=UPI001D095C7E